MLDGSTALSLVTGHGGSGQALRVSLPTFTSEYDPNSYVALEPGFAHGPWADFSGAVVIQWWFRISTTALDVANSYKWMYLRDAGGNRINENNLTTDYAIKPPTAAFEGGRWQFYVEGTGTANYPLGYQPVGPYFAHNRSGQPASLNDYTWHRETLLLRPQSSKGARDGRLAAWMDGIKIIDVSAATLDVTPTGGDLKWCYSSNPFYGSGANDLDNVPVDHVRMFTFPGNYQPSNTPAVHRGF